ncbi:hypothetical protein M9H77_09407 [Catharanthus roseus]|uniref:Uncharacterized protein n=1 Tax=Catharanthus roseus TaxID=4058 RepID=A0ACC0C0I5_CATRO|nr:hypothetical protein M9H77_09407 [Catharanthus roseus]
MVGRQQVRPTTATAAACKFTAFLSAAAATQQLMKQKFQQRSIQQSLMQSPESAIFFATRISTSVPTTLTISYESAATETAPTGFHFASATNINASAANCLNMRRM